MSVYADLEEFLQAHRPHGEFDWWTSPPKGYQVHVACPCGAVFERWAVGYGSM